MQEQKKQHLLHFCQNLSNNGIIVSSPVVVIPTSTFHFKRANMVNKSLLNEKSPSNSKKKNTECTRAK